MNSLKVVEIYRSLEGECTAGGPLQWTIFVRTFGCNLRCYAETGGCDTPYALDREYQEYNLLKIFNIIRDEFGMPNRVTFTGGEPLLQAYELCQVANLLRDHGYHTNLETNGTIYLSPSIKAAFNCIIMDVKTPSAVFLDEVLLNITIKNYNSLRDTDYTKFVISDAQDYEWAVNFIQSYATASKVAFGLRWQSVGPKDIYAQTDLINQLAKDGLFQVRLNMQLHKYIWPEINRKKGGEQGVLFPE